MPLSTISSVAFDADVTHLRGDFKRPAAPQKRKTTAPTADPEAESGAFRVVDEGAPSPAGRSILAQALAAYSEN